MKSDKRFELLKMENPGMSYLASIFKDKQTGVHYLFVAGGAAGGLTVLLDKDGKPVIDERTN